MRLLVALLPPSHREWGEALAAEAAYSNKSVRWAIGGVRLVAWSWFDWMTGGNVVKAVVATTSVINLMMGVFLFGLFATTNDMPRAVPMLALGLVVQGGYTLVYLAGGLGRFEPWSIRALLAGETVALSVGTLGFATTAVNNILGYPLGPDPEYGPLTVGALIVIQAMATLIVFVRLAPSRDKREPVPSEPS